MLRDKNLIPLSHQHQRALALCVRIDRGSPIPDSDVPTWQAEIAQLFRSEITFHFAAEERVLFAAARRFQELTPLIDDLLADHAFLRDRFAESEAATLSSADLRSFAQRLSAHVRKEERQLFERLQELLSTEEMTALGVQLAEQLKDAEQACLIPNQATKLRPAQ
jgi:hemerythrin-like domain-containing protein